MKTNTHHIASLEVDNTLEILPKYASSIDTSTETPIYKTWIPIMPIGAIVSQDGRTFNNPTPEKVIEATYKDGIDPFVDIEHLGEYAKLAMAKASSKDGTASDLTKAMRVVKYEGRAIGWVKKMQIDHTLGLIVGLVEWNDCQYALDSKQWRYISPAFCADKKGIVLRITSASLVKSSAFTMPAVASNQSSTSLETIETKGQDDMDIKVLATKLEDTETQLATVSTERDTLKQELATAQTEKASLANQLAMKDAEALINEGIRAGKIAPAVKEEFMSLAATLDTNKLTAFIDKLPTLATNGMQTPSGEPTGGTVLPLSDGARTRLASLGMTNDEINKHLQGGK